MVIFHAVSLGVLPIISRRLDNEERRAISSGCVYVWEERGAQSEATGLGIERWTDGIRWGPSRVRDEFLFYHEKGTTSGSVDPGYSSESDMSPTTEMNPRPSQRRDTLIKQTYSVFLQNKGKRKWHMIAYFTQDTVDYLRTVDDLPELAAIQVPPGAYVPARCSKGRLRSAARKMSISNSAVPVSSYPAQPLQRERRFRREGDYMPHPSPYSYSPTSYFLSPPPPSALPPSHDSWIVESRPGYRSSPTISRPPSPPSRGRLLGHREQLAPLEYLQNLTPPRRLPFDEKALSALCASY